MDRQEVYKFNPKVQDYKDVRREDLVERRKSKRQDFLDQRRDYTEETKENQGDSQAGIPKGKQTRSVLLQKWKEEHRKNVEKKVKKPFVVGVVRHNAASPMLRPIVPLPPLREVRRTSKAQVIRPQDTPTPATTHHQNAAVYCFGRQKPTEHKFEVSNSVKKLTVPVAPACMNPSRRGNLTSKQKPEASGVSAVKQNPIATQKKTAKENTAPVEKRLTRAMTAAKGTGQQKKSPTKKTVAIKVNEPSTSKANASSRKPRERPESNTSKLRRSSRKTRVAFEEDHDTNEMKTPEKRRIKQKIVPTPAVLRDSNKEPSTSKLRISSRKTRVAIFVDDHDNEEIKTPQVSRSMKNRVRTPAVKSNEDEEALEAMETDSNECAVNSTKGAQEFYGNLERESDLLLKCCDRWSKPAFTELVPQEVSDEIDSTVGQARLLVSDKFQQFKHLIQRFEEGSQPPVTAQDLHGFWDMIYIQVDKMKERFDQLTELKNCNWQKKTEQVVAKKRVASKPKAVKPVVKSRFQEFMAKKKMKNTKKSCDSQNVTPNKESQSNTDTPTGTPLLDRVKHLAVDKKSERRRSSLASASRVLRTSLIAKTLATPTPFTGNTTGGDIDQQ